MRFLSVGLCFLALRDVRGEIRVRIQDYAETTPQTLAKAKTVASEILERVGVRVQWVECPWRAVSENEACRPNLGPANLQIRILSQAMAKRSHASRSAMGYAMVTGPFPDSAYVFHHRAVELEGGNLATRGDILGAIMAHEIGHLLLEEMAHSDNGILQATWRDRDLKLIAQGKMTFSREQAVRLTAASLHRQKRAKELEQRQLE